MADIRTISNSTDNEEVPTDVAPAAGVLAGETPSEPVEQAGFFKEHGYLILRETLDRKMLNELDSELTRIARSYNHLKPVREGFDMEPDQSTADELPVFRKIGGITDCSDSFARLMRHPRIVEVLHRLCPEDIHLFRDVVMMKPARVGREKPWHQDSLYWSYQPMELVSAMTALDDAAPENGCLQIVPGSHKKAMQHSGRELRFELNEEQQQQTRYVPLKAGDTLLFHSLLWHASEPNRTDNERRVCIISYLPSQLIYTGNDDPPAPIIVSRRGEFLGH